MATNKTIRDRIHALKLEYDKLRHRKESLLTLLDEAEISESVYNSNAIENSTLSLKETERVLMEMEVLRDVSVREVYEAKNLALVMEYIREKGKQLEIDEETILLLHKMLMGNIEDSIAGRFRKEGEYVRVSSHIAASPEKIPVMMRNLMVEFSSDKSTYFVDAIAKFHLEIEHIHPFNDGNGRIGRVLINEQLIREGFPVVIIRDKEKKEYYEAFSEYNSSNKKKTKRMERIVALALLESLHKRITYLKGKEVITLADYSKTENKSLHSLINAAHRQSISAFREKGVWKIGI